MPFQQIDVGPRNPLCEQPRLGLAPIASLREPPDQKPVRPVIDEDLGCGRGVGNPQQSCPVIWRKILGWFAMAYPYGDGMPRRHRQRGNLVDDQPRPEPIAPRLQFVSKEFAEAFPLAATRWRLRVPLILGERQVEFQCIEDDLQIALAQSVEVPDPLVDLFPGRFSRLQALDQQYDFMAPGRIELVEVGERECDPALPFR